MCLCTMCMLSAQEGQEKELETVELKLWMVVTLHMGAGN